MLYTCFANVYITIIRSLITIYLSQEYRRTNLFRYFNIIIDLLSILFLFFFSAPHHCCYRFKQISVRVEFRHSV